ncbi:hypothetical protein ABPG72_011588 [Tetrahymena utriculariae]
MRRYPYQGIQQYQLINWLAQGNWLTNNNYLVPFQQIYIDTNMMTDEDTDGIQLLTQDGKRQRIFVVGQPEKVIDFIEKVKSHNQDYIEDYNIDEEDNELAQINFKRPISNKQIIKIKKQLSTINIINNGISINNSNNSNSSLKQEEVELLTSNDKYNNLIKLREYFKRPLNKLEQLRTRKRSIHSSSNSNSNRNSSIGSSSNMSNSFSSSMGHSTSSSVAIHRVEN